MFFILTSTRVSNQMPRNVAEAQKGAINDLNGAFIFLAGKPLID